MDSTARWLGYGTAFAALALLLWLLATLRSEFSRPAHVVRVRFPETGTLRVEDPVTKRGVVVGKVRAVAPEHRAALVTLELFTREPLKADARFVNFNHSLMGDRMVVLVPGEAATALDESRVQEGFFADGVAETIHSVDRLLAMVLRYDSLSGRLRAPRNEPGSLSGLAEDKLYPAFDELTRLAGAVEKAGRELGPTLNGLESTTVQLESMARTVHHHADTLVRFASLAALRLDSLTALGTRIAAEVDSLMLLMAGPDAALRPLVYERTVYERTLQLTEVLRSALKVLSHDGLDIIHGRNLHFFRRRASEAEGAP